MPVYNAEKYLGEAIESVLRQTYTDIELLLINDRSTDRSQEICVEYSKMDSRIRWKNLKENLGIAENTNAAFAMASGEFIGLLDHDDLLAEYALYECVRMMNEYPADLSLFREL